MFKKIASILLEPQALLKLTTLLLLQTIPL